MESTTNYMLLILIFLKIFNSITIYSIPIHSSEQKQQKVLMSNNASLNLTSIPASILLNNNLNITKQLNSTTILNNKNNSVQQQQINNNNNVYRFDLQRSNLSKIMMKMTMMKPNQIYNNPIYDKNQNQQQQHSLTTITTKKIPTTITTNNQNDDKNWLLTKAWLIDNINRLRRELNELQHDYNKHIDHVHQDNLFNQKQLVDDIIKLRADHQYLSQQQKQIIYLIKRNQYLKTKTNDLKLKLKIADVPTQQHLIKDQLSSSSSTEEIFQNKKLSRKRPMMKRDISTIVKSTETGTGKKTKLFNSNNNFENEHFEHETRRNIKEIYEQLSSLHDISLILFDYLKTIERKMDIRNKLSR